MTATSTTVSSTIGSTAVTAARREHPSPTGRAAADWHTVELIEARP